MRLRITHETAYAYEADVRSAIQLLRVEPHSHAGQRIGAWRVQVDAPGRLRRGEDAFGNVTHAFYLGGRTRNLHVRVSGEVETTDTSGVLAGAPEPFPPAAFLRETSLTKADDGLKALAAQARCGGADRLSQMHALLGLVSSRMRFEMRATSPSTTAAQAWAAGRGVCQDMAHVFIAAARLVGAPARYVSGHLFRPGVEWQEAGHAWAEAYVDGLGWVGFDPANAISPTPAYLRVASGPDYAAASPVRGSRVGGGEEYMKVNIRVEERR